MKVRFKDSKNESLDLWSSDLEISIFLSQKIEIKEKTETNGKNRLISIKLANTIAKTHQTIYVAVKKVL